MKYPKELKNSRADIRVLYEKTDIIGKSIAELNKKIDAYNEKQAENERRFGELEERTQTTKYIVYSSFIMGIAAILTTILNGLNM